MSTWRVLAASARGASHQARQVDNQDAWSEGRSPAGAVVVAVADGHGHPRHFRSAVGSRLATEVAQRACLDWVDQAAHGQLASPASAPAWADAVRFDLLPRVWAGWNSAVARDLEGQPFSAEEERQRVEADDPVVAYGSTLLLAMVAGRWACLAQVGDGDVLAVGPGGATSSPLPKDPRLDGQRTTSLCQSDALDAFRVAVVDLATAPVALLLLATDGYGNAQADDPWEPGVGADLAAMVAERGVDWVAGHLPEWVVRCASSEGSGDDTTLALIVAPDPPRAWARESRTTKRAATGAR